MRVIFSDPNDRNRLTMQGTIANDTIDASFVLPPGGEPNAQVLMPWGTIWAFTPGAPAPLNTLQIEGREGDDVIKACGRTGVIFAWPFRRFVHGLARFRFAIEPAPDQIHTGFARGFGDLPRCPPHT